MRAELEILHGTTKLVLKKRMYMESMKSLLLKTALYNVVGFGPGPMLC